MKIRQFKTTDVWLFGDDGEIIKHLTPKEAKVYNETTEKWFANLLAKYKNDTSFIKESDIFEICENAAKKALETKQGS